MNKRITCVFAALLMVCLSIRAEEEERVYWDFNSDTGVLTISGKGPMTDFTPETALGGNLYIEDEIKKIVIKEGVTSIGDYAFYKMPKVISVSIPSTVKEIGEGAFWGLSKVTSLTLPNSIESIGHYAFNYMYGISSLNIPSSISSFGHGFLGYCTKLSSITLDASNTKYYVEGNCIIETSTKKLVAGLRNSVIPSDVKCIGEEAFYGNSGAIVEIPESVTEIESKAFYASDLTSITLPASLKTIGFMGLGSNKLETITCYAKTPPVFISEICSSVGITLMVPNPETYETTSWRDEVSEIVALPFVDIVDGETTSYSNVEERVLDKITYTRNFSDTNWQALYIPFSLSYEDWEQDFEVAKINDIHQFDDNNDNVLDRTEMEIVKITDGTLLPNHPYMIRAKSAGKKTVTIENAVLKPTEANSIDCSSVELKYVFTGTYNRIAGETLVQNKYYAMSGGGVKYTTNTNAFLNPFRWYMKIEARNGQMMPEIAEVKVRVKGEDDDVTNIENVVEPASVYTVYGIDGRFVMRSMSKNPELILNSLDKGMYIVNGKKYLVK